MTILYSHAASVTIEEATNMVIADILAGARTTFCFMGPPGVGKTQMAYQIAKAVNYDVASINVPTTQTESIFIPVPNHESRTTEDYFNAIWGFEKGRPLLINLDEFTKGMLPVQNMLHTLLEPPRRLGSRLMPEGTAVMCTGNFPSVGVGDVLRSHTVSRVKLIPFRSPSSTEWIQNFGIPADVHPYVLATADQYSQWFLSYTDPEFNSLDKDDPIRQIVFNPDPSNPSKGQPYVCPRSMEAASHSIWAWEKSQGTPYAVSLNSLRTQLQGCIGMPAAERMMAVIKMGDEVPSAREIMTHAENKTLANLRRPSSQPAQMFMALNAASWLSGASNGLAKPETRVEVQQRITAWFEYMQGGFTVPVMVSFVENLKVAASKAANDGTKISKLWDVMTSNPTFQKWQTAHLYTH